MNIKDFVTLNILSFSAYFNVFVSFYVFFIENVFSKIPKNLYITIEQVSTFYAYYFIFVIVCIAFFLVEYFVRLKLGTKSIKISKDKLIKNKQKYFFYAGLAIALLFSMLFSCLIIILYI